MKSSEDIGKMLFDRIYAFKREADDNNRKFMTAAIDLGKIMGVNVRVSLDYTSKALEAPAGMKVSQVIFVPEES